MPKPQHREENPDARSFSINFTNSLWLVVPTLKSPSVHEDHAVVAAFQEVLPRRLDKPARMPSAPLVDPPA